MGRKIALLMKLWIFVGLGSLLLSSGILRAEPAPDALPTAVALNYCRASFHRIRKYPTEEVMAEEEQKILNNLNITQLEDKELLTLYTSVLDEISQMGLADKERVLMEKHHTAGIRRQVSWDALAFGTDLAMGQFGNAVRTGANSWWDYRNKAFERDIDLHKIDKSRVTSVVQRSSLFLDTFWKLARRKEIPDRWLVRGDDLDQLETALSESDPQVRERVLRRMEPYMEAYPPYWYYVARTKQELGQLAEAAEIYARLESMAAGHFRKDELLSTALANLAAIQDYLGDDTAVASAERSLNYSTDVWEANLVAARVLQRHGQIARAEDAILRNLDVNLERQQSHVFLAALYYFNQDKPKLARLLHNADAVANLPAPVLLRCAALVGIDQTPPVVVNNLMASLEAFPPATLAGEPLVVRMGYAWQLHLARLKIAQDGQPLPDPQVVRGNGFYDLRFPAAERSLSLRPSSSAPQRLDLEFTYPDETVVKLTLIPQREPGERAGLLVKAPASLRISDVKVGDQTVVLRVAGMVPAGPEGRQPTREIPRPVRESGLPVLLPVVPAGPSAQSESAGTVR